jgi:hypothetical protein
MGETIGDQVIKSIAMLALAIALVCGLLPASAADPDSSAEDRRRFMSVARQLEQAPLEPRLAAERQWALNWLVDAPDLSVTVCANLWSGLLDSEYPHVSEIVVQSTLSMAAAMMERPDIANEPVAQQVAGVEGALKAYRSILRDKPGARSQALETMLGKQARGELPALIGRTLSDCSEQQSESIG